MHAHKKKKKKRARTRIKIQLKYKYSQLSPCGHLAITDTPIKRTAAKSPAETNYRRLTEKQLPLLRTLANEDTNSRSLQCPL